MMKPWYENLKRRTQPIKLCRLDFRLDWVRGLSHTSLGLLKSHSSGSLEQFCIIHRRDAEGTFARQLERYD